MTAREKRKRKSMIQRRWVERQPPEWSVWRGIKKRCNYAKHPQYEYYGGKGIRVCDRWMEHGVGFKNFLADMGPRPSPLHELDRKDSSKDYCPENCRWLSRYDNRSRANSLAWV